jgi:hypothetical protein
MVHVTHYFSKKNEKLHISKPLDGIAMERGSFDETCGSLYLFLLTFCYAVKNKFTFIRPASKEVSQGYLGLFFYLGFLDW